MAAERLRASFSLRNQLWFRWTGKYFETATSHMQTVVYNLNQTLKIGFKIIGIIILLIFLYFIEMVIFLLIFGEGGQASSTLDNGLTKFIMYTLPLLIVGRIAYKTILKQKK